MGATLATKAEQPAREMATQGTTLDGLTATGWLKRAMVDGMAPFADPVPVVVDVCVGPT